MITANFRTQLRKTILTATLTLLGSTAFLWLAVAPPNAQAGPLGPLSDSVKVSVNGLPLVDFSIDESQEGSLHTILVPRTIIELLEPNDGLGGSLISDRLVIEQYVILFQSDPPGTAGLPGRTIPGADVVKVPENFSPISLRFGSDVENSDGTEPSDFVDVIIAGLAQPIHIVIDETGTTEIPIDFSGGPFYFDMLEDDGTLSDTLDIEQFAFTFESDGEVTGLPLLPEDPNARYFTFLEQGADGNGLVFSYDVIASSDAEVPEPASVALAAMALMGLVGLVRRR